MRQLSRWDGKIMALKRRCPDVSSTFYGRSRGKNRAQVISVYSAHKHFFLDSIQFVCFKLVVNLKKYGALT